MRIHLGGAGEDSWRRLRAAYVLERRRGVALVLSEHGEALDECRRRLTGEAPLLQQLAPTRKIVDRVHEVARRGVGKSAPVVWIQADGADLDAAWRAALARLNLAREELGAAGPVFMVLAGPPGLGPIVGARAPDLASVIRPTIALQEGPSMVSDGVVQWLHLSDIHLRAGQDWQQQAILAALQRDLPGLLASASLAPAFVVVSGDLGWSGKKEELDEAHRFLTGLMATLGLPPRERLFLVPGNHDADRSAIPRMVRRDQEAFLALARETPDAFVKEVGEILGSPRDLAQYGLRLAAWCELTSDLLGAARQVTAERPWRTDIIEIDGVTVGVASLCSAWASGPDEEAQGRVVLGERQVRDALAELRSARVRMVVLHHPPEWLAEPERAAIRGLLRQEAHLVLHGHLHEPEMRLEQVPGGGMLVTAAGACTVVGRYELGFQAGRLDLSTGELALHFFGYSRRDGGYWHADSGAARGADGGVARLSLASLAAPPVAETGPAASEGLAARLRRQAALVHGQVSFIGLPDHAPKPNATLADLFVPLTFGGRAGPDGGVDLTEVLRQDEDVDLTEVLRRVDEGGRAVVLGDAGSGKTTLTRYLAVREATREGGRVPLLIPLRELVRQGRRDGLLAFAADDATARLVVRTTEADLEALCQAGQALVLVDGMDEVADAGDRERIRDCVDALAAAWPGVPIVATSRVVGYDAAPLGNGFETLRLRAFDDAQVERFVNAWYAVAEPRDPVERSRLQAELLAALEAEPRAMELARNPLLATLIALVHRYEANLPGERARLYELVVRLLLETWPRVRRQRFTALDEGRQREILERLALRMQEGRSRGDRSVSIGRGELEEALAELLRERDLADRSLGEARRVAAAWVDFLAAATGLLVEQTPGVFTFLHLSLLEYLAGRALLARELVGGDVRVAETVERLHADPRWRETLLLMLGSEATRGPLIDAVYDVLAPVGVDLSLRGGAFFLLAMLREEVDVRPAQRERILDAALSREAGEWSSTDSFHDLRSFHELIRFSRRHGPSVREWLRDGLATLVDERLITLAILAPGDWDPAPILDPRPDASDVPRLLLFFGPKYPWGLWAEARATVSDWLYGLGECHDEYLFSWSVRWLHVGLRGTGRRAISVALALRVACIGAHEVDFINTHRTFPRGDGLELPTGGPAMTAAEGSTLSLGDRVKWEWDRSIGGFFGTARGAWRLLPELRVLSDQLYSRGGANPANAPLILSLGLSHFQATWKWPDSASWRALFAADPPEDWLAAHLWHICQAVGDPDNPAHMEAAAAALARGDSPVLVEALRSCPLIPTPPDQLALFPEPPPPRTRPGG